MSPEILVSLVSSAVLAIFASVTAPLILAHRTERLHREDRLADWERQDRLAAEARKAAADARERADETGRRLTQVSERGARANEKVSQKLDVIHTLVNSNMTAALQSAFDAMKRELALMRQVIALNQEAGRDPTLESLAAIAATEDKLKELGATLADRAAADRAAAALPQPPPGEPLIPEITAGAAEPPAETPQAAPSESIEEPL